MKLRRFLSLAVWVGVLAARGEPTPPPADQSTKKPEPELCCDPVDAPDASSKPVPKKDASQPPPPPVKKK